MDGPEENSPYISACTDNNNTNKLVKLLKNRIKLRAQSDERQ
jgi:hypothetical protein